MKRCSVRERNKKGSAEWFSTSHQASACTLYRRVQISARNLIATD